MVIKRIPKLDSINMNTFNEAYIGRHDINNYKFNFVTFTYVHLWPYNVFFYRIHFIIVYHYCSAIKTLKIRNVSHKTFNKHD